MPVGKKNAGPGIADREDKKERADLERKDNNKEKKEGPGKHEPFLLAPAGKDYLWGGRRLKDDFSKDLPLSPLAETWECSTHPDGISSAASGEYAGMLLTDILILHPEFLGTHPARTVTAPGQIPILIKFIDAKKDLSVQVHPDDAYAAIHENGSRGKDEMWYVVDAKKDTKLVYGFNRDLEKKTVRDAIRDGTIAKYLQRIPVERGDVFYIKSGTVHALGSGALVCEIQESSNITYRLYDYDRVDKTGKKRPLQVEKALEVSNFKGAVTPRQPMQVAKYTPGMASRFLCRCRYFEVERLLVNTERVRIPAGISAGRGSFIVLVCTDGCGVLFWRTPGNEEKSIRIFRGDTIFLPADSVTVRIHGKAGFLKVNC